MKHRPSPFRQGATGGALGLIFLMVLPAQAAKNVTEYSQEELMAVALTSVHRESQYLSDEAANE